MTIKLEGSNLGDKHKHLNNLSLESSETYSFDTVDLKNGDVVNLIKIDIASRNKNVDYILKVLTCEDLLYVSRALNRCTWLITDSEFKHIINPEYLYHTLFPQMTSKAAIKLTKYIKLRLKESDRVEQFYQYEEDPKKAVEWLPHCSIEFIDANINKHISHIDVTLLRRLCERSISVLEFLMNNNDFYIRNALQATIFLINQDLERYLDIIEKQPQYMMPRFNKHSTEIIMKRAGDRIFKNFNTYCNHIHVSTFIKYLKKENIKTFLLDNIFKDNEVNKRRVNFEFETLKTFVSSIPEKDRIEFIMQVLIDKIYVDDKCLLPRPLKCSMKNFDEFTNQYKYIYLYDHFWYRYIPFTTSFTKVQEMITKQTSSDELNSMFQTLIIAAGDCINHLKSFIEYYKKNHKNAKQAIKYTVIKNIITHNNFHKYDEDTWKILEQTFMSDILNEINEDIKVDENQSQICVEAIIIYYTLHMKKVPKTVENRFKFNSMKSYQKKLEKEENDVLFTYLYNTIIRKFNNHSSSTKEEFSEKSQLLTDALDLLIDWSKDLANYPAVINAIRDLINVNEQNALNEDLSNIYNKKKSWKKVMFNECIKMYPSQPVLINVLKHDPTLLTRYETKVENIYFNNNIFLKQYYKKIKIYWSDTLAKQLINTHLDKLTNLKYSKAAVRALCILLPEDDFQKLLTEYTPKGEKVDWNQSSEFTLSIQQNLAKIMHNARPQPVPNLIINYAKGDYLPFALPSLYSIFHNINLKVSQQFIPQLLDNKVSLQKHGIRLAFIKLPPDEFKNILSEVLDKNKNSSIRLIAFQLTFKLLCKEKDPERLQAIWNIMEIFLDKLSNNENGAIYDLLLKVEEVPMSVRPLYYMKSYNILKNYIANKNSESEKYEYRFDYSFIDYAHNIIDELSPEFITKVIFEFIEKDFTKSQYIDGKLQLLSSYLLSSDDEESQMKKYTILIVPLLQVCVKDWDLVNDNKKYVVRLNLDRLLKFLRKDVKEYVFNKNKILPTKLFQAINAELMKNLDYPRNYLFLTKWQLTVDFIDNFDKDDENDWNTLCESLPPNISKCKKHLLDHCEKYFSNIYVLFAKALHSCIKDMFEDDHTMLLLILRNMLYNENYVPVYLTVLKIMQHIYLNEDVELKTRIKELFKMIGDHPSAEVQIHYYHCRNVHLSTISEDIDINTMKEMHADLVK